MCIRYFAYYVPLLAWIPQYRWTHLQGDLIAAITMASFYIPMALSLASNLAHVPPINGLYSFVFNPVRSMLISMLHLLQEFAGLMRITDYLCYSWILPSVSGHPLAQRFSLL